MRVFLDELCLVIIDEVSMVGSDTLYKVNQLLQEIFISEDLFGGKGMFLVGDLLQLKPVNNRFIFKRPKTKAYAYKFKCLPLWEWFDVVLLEENKRQGKDNSWTKRLNRIRIGQPTQEDLEVLDTRKVSNFPNIDFGKALHAFYTNEEVKDYNDKKLNDYSSQLYKIEASIKAPRGINIALKPHGTIEDTNFLMVLKIKVGARVKMIWNVDIADKLVNGSIGTVTDIVTDNSRNVTAIIVDFDNPKSGQEQMQRYGNSLSKAKGCPVFRTISESCIPFKDNSGRHHGASIKISQFPLKLSWASTAHGLQGTTVEKGSNMVVHGHKKIPPAMIYVMLGRCQDLNNVFQENLDYKKIVCEKDALEETSRLAERNIVPGILSGSNEMFFMNIRSMECHFEDLLCDPEANKSSCICLVETWIKESSNVTFDWQGKEFYHCSKGRGKGCAMFTSDTMTNKQPFLSFGTDKFQICSMRIFPTFQVLVLYLSKGCDKDQVVAVMMDIIDNIEPKVYPLILGDFNFGSKEENNLTNYLMKKDFVQLVHFPTQVEGRTIDHCYVPNTIKETIDLKGLFCYYSDHARLILKIKQY